MSQDDRKTKEIDGTTYGVYMLPPRLARKILVRIFQVLAPSAGEAFKREEQEVLAAIGPVLATLADRLNDEDLGRSSRSAIGTISVGTTRQSPRVFTGDGRRLGLDGVTFSHWEPGP